jgi:hypothetical protein
MNALILIVLVVGIFSNPEKMAFTPLGIFMACVPIILFCLFGIIGNLQEKEGMK